MTFFARLTKTILVVIACALSAWAYDPATIPTQFGIPPGNVPVFGCDEVGQGVTQVTKSQGYCSFHDFAIKHDHGIYARVTWQTVDTGTTGPLYSGWATADALFQNYAPVNSVNTVTSITCANPVCTVVFPSNNPFSASANASVCFWNTSVADYNAIGPTSGTGCFALTGVTYSGTGCASSKPCLTGATFNFAGAHSASSGGVVTFACGDALYGAPHPCYVKPITVHHQSTASSVPPYIYGQAWANLQATPGWVAGSTHLFGETLLQGSTYYQETALNGNGQCAEATTLPTFNTTVGQSTTDGTCTWLSYGANANPQEAVVGSGYAGGGNDPPAGNYAGGGAIFNINSAVGSGTGKCSPSACAAADVMLGLPMWNENSYLNAIVAFNTSQNDGSGNPGVIYHYATVAWAVQCKCIFEDRLGMMDQGEVFHYLETVLASSSWTNMTYAQFKGLYIDGYVSKVARANYAAWLASGATWKLDAPTNCFSNGNNLNDCLDYFNEIVSVIKAAGPLYGYGNQGLYVTDTTTEAVGGWAGQITGSEYPNFRRTLIPDRNAGAHRHLQFQARTCPANGNAGHCTNPGEGSLAQFAQLITLNNVDVLEWVSSDDQNATWDSRYTYANGVSSGIEYADAQADNYQAYANNIAQGLPSNTGGVQ